MIVDKTNKINVFSILILCVTTLFITGFGNNYELYADEFKKKRSPTMPKQYVFFYLMNKDMKKDVNEIKENIEQHIRYWNDKKLENYSGGPFSDRSGGMILFNAGSMHAAEKLALNDPFVINELISTKWIKEWDKQ